VFPLVTLKFIRSTYPTKLISFKHTAAAVMDRAPVYKENNQRVASSALESKNLGVA